MPAPGLETRLTTNDARLVEPLAQLARVQIVLLEDVLPDLDETWLGTHCSISRATSSSSLPRSTCGVGVPHTAQQNNCTLLSSRSASALRADRPRREPPRSPAGIPSNGVSAQAISYDASSASGTTPDSAPIRRCSAHTRAASFSASSCGHVYQAQRYRELVHGPSAPSAACPRLMPPSFGGTTWLTQQLEPVILQQTRELVSSITFWNTPPDATTARSL